MIFSRWKPLLGALLFWTAAISTPLAHAHDDHEGGDEISQARLIEVYQTLYRKLVESLGENSADPEAVLKVFFSNQDRFTNQDAIGALLQQALTDERMHILAHEREHADHDHPHPNEPWVTWVLKKLRQTASFFVFGLPTMFFDGYKEYGTSFAIYTVITEAIEHTFIPHPAFCKILQGFYFSTAGFAFNFCRINQSQLIQTDETYNRTQAAFFAVRNEVLFKYSWNFSRAIFDPHFELMKRKVYSGYLKDVGAELGLLHRFLLGTQFWGDVYAQMDTLPAGDPISSRLGDQITGDARAEKLWRVHRMASFLKLFVKILRDASLEGVEEKFYKFRLSPSEYARFVGVRKLLGSTALILEKLKSEFYALASSNDPRAYDRGLPLYGFLNEHIVPLLGRLMIVGQDTPDSPAIATLKADLKRILSLEKSLIKNGWTHPVNCQTQLDGSSAGL